MKNPELSAVLLGRESQISADDVYCLELDTLVRRGLRVVTLCNDGRGRSALVAEELNRKNIPSVRLDGGIFQFFDGRQDPRCAIYIYNALNNCPNVAVILTPEEISEYYAFLGNLRCLKYKDTNSAIKSMINMES